MAAREMLNAGVMPAGEAQDKRCYTVEEVMQILGICRRSVYELIGDKKFRAVKVGNKYRISKASFDRWLDELG